jgi:membrane-associated phospholipid phosphatase
VSLRAGVLLSLCILAPGTLLAAEGSDAQPPAPRSLELSHTSPAWLAGELGVASGVFVTGLVLSTKAPESCRWCEGNGFDESVRRALLAAHPREAGMVSDIAVTGVLPSFALGALLVPAYAAGRRGHAAENLVIVATATGLTLGLTVALKNVVARQRPAELHGERYRSPAADHPSERYVSFYSSHTAVAFAVASSATTVSYLRGYAGAPYVAVFGAGIGVGVGLLRIAADMHWATDVLAGAGVGTLIGTAVPLLLHRRAESAVSIVPSFGRGFAGLDVRGSL